MKSFSCLSFLLFFPRLQIYEAIAAIFWQSASNVLVLLHNLTLTYLIFQFFASNLTIPYPVHFCLLLGLKNRGAENNASAPLTLRIELLKALFDQIFVFCAKLVLRSLKEVLIYFSIKKLH